MKELKYIYPVNVKTLVKCPYFQSFHLGTIGCANCKYFLGDRIDGIIDSDIVVNYELVENPIKFTLMCNADETLEKNKLSKNLLIEKGVMFF